MKFTETRILLSAKLRSLCIKNGWYTRGDNDEYSRLFNRLTDLHGCPEHMTTEKMVEIAIDIWEHSDIDDYTIEGILFVLARACYSYFKVIA